MNIILHTLWYRFLHTCIFYISLLSYVSFYPFSSFVSLESVFHLIAAIFTSSFIFIVQDALGCTVHAMRDINYESTLHHI